MAAEGTNPFCRKWMKFSGKCTASDRALKSVSTEGANICETLRFKTEEKATFYSCAFPHFFEAINVLQSY